MSPIAQAIGVVFVLAFAFGAVQLVKIAGKLSDTAGTLTAIGIFSAFLLIAWLVDSRSKRRR